MTYSSKYRKPLLLMYNDNYRYGTGLYAPAVHYINSRNRDFDLFMYPPSSIPLSFSRPPPSIPRVPLMEHDLYAPISFGYGRNLRKPRAPPQKEPRISGRYYPAYYGMDEY